MVKRKSVSLLFCHTTYLKLLPSSIKTVSAADFPNRKQNFMHILCSLLSAIIKIAELPSRRLEKSHNNNNSQPRLMPHGSLVEYCVDSRHLAAHCAPTSSSCATFQFRLYLGTRTYIYMYIVCIFETCL